MKKITFIILLLISFLGFSQNLVINGDFQANSGGPANNWTGSASNAVDLGGNNIVNQANVTAPTPGAPYNLNLSQNILLENGKTYELKFDAFTDVTTGSRTIIAGLGQNNAPYAALTQTPTLTSTPQTFSYNFTINYGDAVGDRVLFDLNDEAGYVFIDNVSVTEFVDATPPTGFTATVGTIGSFGVELLLNATDDSGSVIYDITYNSGANSVQTTGASGVEKSFTVTGLTQETAYTFEVSASDASGNTAANNPITGLNATTLADTNTSCAGFSNEASEGSYSVGYNYSFTTTGTDVNVTFELLDTDKTGFNPQIFIAPSTFINMNGGSAPVYTGTISGFANGDMPNFAIRGAYAGGLVTSKVFDYAVGDNCVSTPSEEDVTLSDLKIDGVTIAGFSPSTTTYNIKLPDASSTPQVTLVTTTNTNATLGTITQASSVPGSATFDVTSEDTNFVETYTINFSIQVPLTELIGNGGFETGDFTDWDLVPSSSGQTIITTNPSEGTYAANIINTVPTTAVGIKSSNRGIGIVNPGDQVTVKFDVRGSFDIGGVLFAELFSEFSGGGASNQILGGGPLALNADPNVWKSFEFTVNLGSDVGGGVSLLFNANTGGGNSANVFIDNVSIVNNDQVLSIKDFKIAGLNAFPNPTQDSWTIKTQNIKMSTIKVYDILGKNVLSIAPNDTEAIINATSLKAGLYFVQIKTANGLNTVKLVKE